MNNLPYIFRFKRIKNKICVTNDFGFYVLLDKERFDRFISCRDGSDKKDVLKEKNFFQNYLDIEWIARRNSEKNFLNWKGPLTHIISITRKCKSNCVYCAVDSAPNSNDNMDISTAKQIIDFVFSWSRKDFMIEFQGGEPLLNFEVLKYITEYAKDKSKKTGKKVYFSVVTNLLFLNRIQRQFLIKNKITVCTSLDGPHYIHNKTRPCKGIDSYSTAIKNLKILKIFADRNIIETPNVITTVTRDSLKYHKEIIDEYVTHGIMRVQLGILDPIGRAAKNRKDIGYTADEYFNFYKKAIKYILYLNIKKGIPVYEKGLFGLIYDILNFKFYRYKSVDIFLRLSYDFKGNIYPSDEARLLAENGDDIFKIGNVFEGDFQSVVKKDNFRALMIYNFNNLFSPLCFRCPYSIWCSISPAYNYSAQKSPFGNMVLNERCKIFKKIFDMTVELIENKKYREVFNDWFERYI